MDEQKSHSMWSDPELLDNLPRYLASGDYERAYHQAGADWWPLLRAIKPPFLIEYIYSEEYPQDIERQKELYLNSLSQLVSEYVNQGGLHNAQDVQLEKMIERRFRYFFALKEPGAMQRYVVGSGLRSIPHREISIAERLWREYVEIKISSHQALYQLDPEGYRVLFGLYRRRRSRSRNGRNGHRRRSGSRGSGGSGGSGGSRGSGSRPPSYRLVSPPSYRSPSRDFLWEPGYE